MTERTTVVFDVPRTFTDVKTYEIDAASGVATLTHAGERWAKTKGLALRRQYTLDVSDDGEVTFTGFPVAEPEEEKKDTGAGLKPNWFRGVAPAGETMRGPMWTGESYSIGDIDVSGMSARVRAALDAYNAGYKAHEFEVIVGTGNRAGYVSWQAKGAGTPADETWTVYEADDGSIFMYDKEVGPSSRVSIAQASTITPTGPNVEQIGKGIKNSDGSVTKFYSVKDSEGRTSMQTVKEWDTITKDSVIPLETGGRLIPTGGGRYTYEPPPEAPFTTSPDDVVKVAGGQLVKTSKNQYQFVRDTYDPGVKEHKDSQGNVRQFTQSASGTWTELAPRADPGVVESGGREFLQQYTGALTELDPRYDPEVTDVEGMKLLQQRSGQIGQLTPATLDQIITQALVDNDFDKAFAFQDFRDRPTAQEAFQTALDFARSPADQRIISAIARGITPVQPPPEGTIQRVGPQPDFLIQAYQDAQRRMGAGRAPTEEEVGSLSARAAAGQTPLTDTLQMRLEELKIKNQELRNDAISLKTQQDEQAFQMKNQSLFGGDDTGFSQFKLGLGISSGKDLTDADTATLTRLLAGLPEGSKKAYGEGQIESLYGGGLSVADVIANLRGFTDSTLLADYDARQVPTDAAAVDAGLDASGYNREAMEVFQGSIRQMQAEIAARGGGGSTSTVDAQSPETPATTVTPATTLPKDDPWAGMKSVSPLTGFAGGGTVRPGEIAVVGEQGPEIAMMPPGTHILPLGKATKKDIRAAQSTGRAYQQGGIVFDELEPGLQQLWRGRPITPPRGYLFQQGGLPLPSPQALQNLTPRTRESFMGMAGNIGISPTEFRQELQTATPRGTRLPTSRMLPLGRRGVR
jgi:hypothetical protein